MKLKSTLTIFLAGSIVIGCATTELDRAKQSYSEARNDAMISQNAPATLDKASQELGAAENAKTWTQQDQHAYMAKQYVELAKVQATQSQSRAEAAQLEKEHAELLAGLERQQAEQARMQAEKAGQAQAYMSEKQSQEKAITSGNILFGFNKAEPKSGSEQKVEQLSGFLKNNPDRQVLLEGFTDSIGPKAYNDQLAERRAEAVAKALHADGIKADRITTKGYGPNYPVDTNKTAAGRQQNRRVEITILNLGEQPGEAAKTKGHK